MALQRRCGVAVVITLYVVTSLILKDWPYITDTTPQVKRVRIPSITLPTNPANLRPQRHRSLKYLTEHEMTKDDNEQDLKDMSSAMFSKVHLLNNKSSFSLGEEIQVEIQMYNGNGQKKQRGGDYLRLWMEDKTSGSSVSGDVFDHNTGTYTGILKALWTGRAKIQVFLARHREEIALYYKLYTRFSSIWTNYAELSKRNISERTECSWDSFQIGGKICNFTHLNYGFPWFCKQPTNPKLDCGNWVTITSTTARQFDSSREKDISSLNRSPKESVFRDTLSITVHSDKTDAKAAPRPATPCNKITPIQTWQLSSPNGFFVNNTWHSRLCSDELVHSSTTYGKCLKGKTLWIPGDSTSFQFYNFIKNMLPGHSVKSEKRHEPHAFRNEEFNFEIKWRSHEMPFYNGRKPNNRSSPQAEHIILDSFPNTTKDVVVLYLNIHFTLVHPDVFRRHVRRLVFAAKILLKRAPDVTLAVRGPHAFYKSAVVKQGLSSYWGLMYMDILREEFFPIRNKVFYIDFWDLTVARASHNIHPPNSVIQVMVHNMMSLLCFRKS